MYSPTREISNSSSVSSDIVVSSVSTASSVAGVSCASSIPFSGLIFVLLGVPLGLRVKRGSKATGVI